MFKEGTTGTWTNSNLTRTSSPGTFQFDEAHGLAEDTDCYFALVGEDKTGNRSATPTGSGDDSTLYDTTLPTSGTATSPAFANGTSITVTYDGAGDPGSEASGLFHVELWVKKGPGGD